MPPFLFHFFASQLFFFFWFLSYWFDERLSSRHSIKLSVSIFFFFSFSYNDVPRDALTLSSFSADTLLKDNFVTCRIVRGWNWTSWTSRKWTIYVPECSDFYNWKTMFFLDLVRCQRMLFFFLSYEKKKYKRVSRVTKFLRRLIIWREKKIYDFFFFLRQCIFVTFCYAHQGGNTIKDIRTLW